MINRIDIRTLGACNATRAPRHSDGMSLAKPRRSTLRRRLVWAIGAVVALAVVAAALVFEPWKLVVDQRVQEAAPAASAAGPYRDSRAAR